MVRAHNPVLTAAHPTDGLTVGNGDIALSVDISGLQTFPAFHEIVARSSARRADGCAACPRSARGRSTADDFQIPLRTQSTLGLVPDAHDPRALPLDDTGHGVRHDAGDRVPTSTGWGSSELPTPSPRSSSRAPGSTSTRGARTSAAWRWCDRRVADRHPRLLPTRARSSTCGRERQRRVHARGHVGAP